MRESGPRHRGSVHVYTLSMRVVALTAQHAPVSTDGMTALIERYLGATGFAGAMINRMGKYPAQQPTRYRRTGSLGRNWRLRGPRRSGDQIIAEATNDTGYAVFVQGPKDGTKGHRQTRVMRGKGWGNITDETQKEWPRHRIRIVRVLTQQDTGLRRRRVR